MMNDGNDLVGDLICGRTLMEANVLRKEGVPCLSQSQDFFFFFHYKHAQRCLCIAQLTDLMLWHKQLLRLGPEGEGSGFGPWPYKSKVKRQDYFCVTGRVCKCHPDRPQLPFA